ncbi:hypothetical protein L798_15567 [Zootermopsis nevadensis]|uniref:DUF4773 domain-containing protein n=2 Tax=Zootermopsis nevadensis TaxID=136037 RepID=A0A067QKY8_ZOONE|nr:hypothetical protein L798_15567 [Zootermopsis nevadensis]
MLTSLILHSVTLGSQLERHSPDKRHQTQTSQVLKQRTQFLRLPCSCGGDNCGCCATLSVPPLYFNQQGCVQLTYVPAELGVDLDVLLNGNNLYHTSLSARNPPPFCVGTGVPLLNLCIRLYNIRVQNNNVHVCINLELQFANRPLIVVSFDCVRVGVDGVGIEKPSTSRVMSPDPVRGKHVRTISFTPETLHSSAYTTINSDWNVRSHL